METKFTKGKWIVKGTTIFIDDTYTSIAGIHPINYTEEAKANALLISKAPEMLELLQYFIDNHMLSIQGRRMANQLIKAATEL